MPHEPTDQELVLRLKRGDLTALAALDQRYRVRVVRLIARLAKSYEEAEDIYQEAIFKAASHIESFDHRRSFYSWIHRIAKNQCIDEYRRCRGVEFVENGEVLLRVEGKGHDPLEGLTDEELLEKIQRAIDALPKRQQSIARLRLLEGLEYKEIAQRIGGSVHAAKSLFSVARKTLKAQLQVYLGGLVAPLRTLRWNTKAMEVSTATTMSVSGFLSVGVHLIIVFALCYLPVNSLQTTTPRISKEYKATLMTASSNLATQNVLRTPEQQRQFITNPFLRRLQNGTSVSPKNLVHQKTSWRSMAPLTLERTDFSEGLGAPERHVQITSLDIAQQSPAWLASIETPTILPSTRWPHGQSRAMIAARPVHKNSATIFADRMASPRSPQSLGDFGVPDRVTNASFPATQANLPAISNGFRRLRAFRNVQTLDAYSLAQLRRMVRRLGQYPVLISGCSEDHVRFLLMKGWMPIVILRSIVGGKHLWVITAWDTDAAQVTITNPLEGRSIQLTASDFMRGWQTGSAPQSCLLLSTQPVSKSFQIQPIDSSGDTGDQPRIWH